MECCGEVYVDTATFELVCESCGRVETIMGVAFDEHQFFDQAQGQPPPTQKNNSAHLREIFEKHKILDVVNTTIKEYDPMNCCGEVYVDTETSELVCKRCGRAETIMGVAFDEYQFIDQAQGQPPPTKKNNSTHLRKMLEKLKILDAVNTTIKGHDPKRYRFLEAHINDFHGGGKSVNYVCFLYDYFQAVPSDAWPRKEEILQRLSPRLPKNWETRWRAKARFSEWWKETNPR